MAALSEERIMLGGALGPVAAMLYSLGFAQLYSGLRPSDGWVGPCLAFLGLSTMMVVGGVYHAAFVYTGLIGKALRSDTESPTLRLLLDQHQRYLLYMYRFAAVPGLIGSVAFIATVLSRQTQYPTSIIALAPLFSAPIKLWLKRQQFGGLVLCGGLTNLWNLAFMAAVTMSEIYAPMT